MATIRPFRAVRPAPDKVAQVTSRSYELYSAEEMDATLAANPYSFLHVLNPGLKHRDLPLEQRFQLVYQQYQVFLQQGVLKRDDRPAFYLYRMAREGRVWQGLFCATSTADYRDNIIRKHEDTLPRRETLFASYLEKVRFNAEPVLITYPDSDEVRKLLEHSGQMAPDFAFESQDGASHNLWVIDGQEEIKKLQQAFDQVDTLYIADGHHRSASSLRMAERAARHNPDHKGNEAYNYFMSCLVPESSIRVHAFNRLVRDLNGLEPEAYLAHVEQHFELGLKGPEPWMPEKPGVVGMYLGGSFYSLRLKANEPDQEDPLTALDPQRLQQQILEPLLGITDQRTDPRLQYLHGKHSVNRMKQLIDQGSFKVGFALFPIGMETIKKVADAGLAMPPKSTYIEPKLRSGLTIYEL